MFDYYYALLHEKEFKSNNLMTVNVFKPKDWSLGVNLISKDLADCMREKLHHHYAEILYKAIVNESISDPVSILFVFLRALIMFGFPLVQWHWINKR